MLFLTCVSLNPFNNFRFKYRIVLDTYKLFATRYRYRGVLRLIVCFCNICKITNNINDKIIQKHPLSLPDLFQAF